MKPRLFIASSAEGLPIAVAVQANLQRVVETTVWSQRVFLPGGTTLRTLLEQSDSFDFGLFLLSPEDAVLIRGQEQMAARDNVVLEFGIFANQLGRNRVFILVPDGSTDLRIPTDLLGVTPATYEDARSEARPGSEPTRQWSACNRRRACKRPRT